MSTKLPGSSNRRPLAARAGTGAELRPPNLSGPRAGSGRSSNSAFGGGFVVRVVLQTILVTAVPAALLARGSAGLAGRIFWIVLACVLVRLAFAGRRDELLCVVFAVLPFLNLLRGFLFFHVVPAVIFVSLFYWFASSRAAAYAFLKTHRLVPWLAAFFVAYYLLSFATTGKYEVNLRTSECVLGAILVLVLVRRRAMLAAGLGGLLVSACLFGAALLPHLAESERLGIVRLEGRQLGNPVQLGLPLALALLALLVDRGYWIGLERWGSFRLLLSLPPLALLLLTTSRSSWAVVAIGILCQFAIGKKNRIPVLLALLAGFAVLQFVLASSQGAGLEAGLERTFSSERTARNRTSGRSDQWLVASKAFQESASTMLIGQGAGLGPQIYARKSLETPNIEFEVGREMAFHSLYMQIGVELGLAGLVPFTIWLFVAGRRILAWSSRTGYVLPLAGFLGYMAVAGTVSGNDTISGAFLGLGLIGASYTAERTPERAKREARVHRDAWPEGRSLWI